MSRIYSLVIALFLTVSLVSAQSEEMKEASGMSEEDITVIDPVLETTKVEKTTAQEPESVAPAEEDEESTTTVVVENTEETSSVVENVESQENAASSSFLMLTVLANVLMLVYLI